MKPKFQFGTLRTANVVLKAIEPRYAQQAFDEVVSEYGYVHLPTKTMYDNVKYAIKYLDLLESLRPTYLKSETKIQVGCFLYLYFWQTTKPIGSSTVLLPPFAVCDEKKCCKKDVEQIHMEYECLYHFFQNQKQFVEESASDASVNLSELKTFVSNVLELWEENQSSSNNT